MGSEKRMMGPLIIILLLADGMMSAENTTAALNATVTATAVNMTSPGVNMTTMSTMSPSAVPTSVNITAAPTGVTNATAAPT
uniref:Uncharacterized protein n=1 Tax=Gasterosteus aculeatus TaxID=69293 RepID=G3Q1N8_GASAC